MPSSFVCRRRCMARIPLFCSASPWASLFPSKIFHNLRKMLAVLVHYNVETSSYAISHSHSKWENKRFLIKGCAECGVDTHCTIHHHQTEVSMRSMWPLQSFQCVSCCGDSIRGIRIPICLAYGADSSESHSLSIEKQMITHNLFSILRVRVRYIQTYPLSVNQNEINTIKNNE